MMSRNGAGVGFWIVCGYVILQNFSFFEEGGGDGML